MKKKMVVLFLAAILLLAAIPVFADWYPNGSMGGSPAAVREYSAKNLYSEYTFTKEYVRHTWVSGADKVTSCAGTNYRYRFYCNGTAVTTIRYKTPNTIPISVVSFTPMIGTKIGLRVYNQWQDGVTNMPIKGQFVPYYTY